MPDIAFDSVILRLCTAIVLSGLLGLERERRGRAAGLRTHILVCLGATLSIIISDYMAAEMAEYTDRVWVDRSRVAAGILTGIGFLGAGTIINQGGTPRGLTTAAMIWFAAILGIGIGAGYFLLSTVATMLALVVAYALQYLESFVPLHERMTVQVMLEGTPDVFFTLEKHFEERGYVVLHTNTHIQQEGNALQYSVELGCPRRPDSAAFLKDLQGAVPAIRHIDIRY